MSIIKKAASFALSATMVASAFTGLGVLNPTEEATVNAATVDYGLADTSQEGVILHCWNWSYNNIKKYMKDIAAAGYTSVQTSPVTQPKDYYWEGIAYGDVGIPDGTGDSDHGNWWKVYQPVTMSICDNGYTWFGTKAEFKAMCDEAEKYGVRVIVDIVANHMGNIQGWKIGDEETVMSDISPQVGEFWNPDMLTDSSYWHISTSWTHTSDGRFDVTQGNMGMPDLNTGDSRVQQMVLNLLKECIDCGADGFRFDAAKHIETPADDPAFASDFWDVVLDGARSYYKQVNGYDGVFFYGEILNRIDDTNAEAYYRSKMSLTDNSTSDNIRNSVKYKQASGAAQSGYCGYIAGEADKCVLWAESHDTYMGGGSSYDCTDNDIKRTWAMVGSRKDATALFFARPYYSRYILAGDQTSARQSDEAILAQTDYTQMGDVGTLTWADPSVVAVNRFHNFFVGQSERLGSSGDNVAYNIRGNSGIVISKMDGPGSVSFNVSMADGTYTDQVTGNKFTVSGGVLKGTVASEDGVAVIYNPTRDYGTVDPEEPSVIKISADTESGSTTFTTDSIDVTMKVENATAAYETSEGEKGTFSGSKTITIGSSISGGETVTLTITATGSDGTVKSKTYTYTKKAPRTGYPTLNSSGVVFDNAEYGWSNVYAYVYSDEQNNNGSWPGVAMTEVDGDYWTYELPSKFTGTVYVIFSNGSGTQIPGASQPGLEMTVGEKKLFINDELIDLPESGEEQLVNSSTISETSVTYGDTVTLTGKASGGTSPYTYQFSAKHSSDSSYTILKDYDNSATTKTWRPAKTGTYTVIIRAKDAKGTVVSKTYTLTVNAAASELTNNSTITATSINYGDTITFTGKASGGAGSYQYRFAAKHSTDADYTILKDYGNSATTKVWRPRKTGTYTVLIRAKDANGTVVSKTYTLKVNAAASALTNNSTITATSINYGSTITFTGKASGGAGSYQYRFAAKHSTDASYTILKDYNSSATTKVWRPRKTGTYTVLIRAKDKNGTVASKTYTLTVKQAATLTNKSTITATSITYGDTITFTGKASGGSGSYQYRFAAKHSSSSSYTILKDYSNSATTKVWRPTKSGTYTVLIRAKDKAGTVASKTYTLSVVAPLTNKATISATSINYGNTITFTGKASGGAGSYQYRFAAKHSSASSYTILKDYDNSATTKVWRPTKTGRYTVLIRVKDKNGTVASKTLTLNVK